MSSSIESSSVLQGALRRVVEGEQVDPALPASVVAQVRDVPGVRSAVGMVSADGARVIGSGGEVVPSYGPPRLGGNWLGEDDLIKLREGRGPQRDDEIAVNAAVAKAGNLKVGD